MNADIGAKQMSFPGGVQYKTLYVPSGQLQNFQFTPERYPGTRVGIPRNSYRVFCRSHREKASAFSLVKPSSTSSKERLPGYGYATYAAFQKHPGHHPGLELETVRLCQTLGAYSWSVRRQCQSRYHGTGPKRLRLGYPGAHGVCTVATYDKCKSRCTGVVVVPGVRVVLVVIAGTNFMKLKFQLQVPESGTWDSYYYYYDEY
eukprot:2598879-Rhodomonas_salina.1